MRPTGPRFVVEAYSYTHTHRDRVPTRYCLRDRFSGSVVAFGTEEECEKAMLKRMARVARVAAIKKRRLEVRRLKSKLKGGSPT